jgi:heavy metal-binding protein
MKNIIWSAVMILLLTACKKNEEASTVKTETNAVSESVDKDSAEQLYSCPMHPEVTGKKGEKCPKCEMDLTEAVSQ